MDLKELVLSALSDVGGEFERTARESVEAVIADKSRDPIALAKIEQAIEIARGLSLPVSTPPQAAEESAKSAKPAEIAISAVSAAPVISAAPAAPAAPQNQEIAAASLTAKEPKFAEAKPAEKSARQENPARDLASGEMLANQSVISGEEMFLETLRERVLTLFVGLQSPNCKNLEAKLDLTFNFFEYLLSIVEDRLAKIREIPNK
ncbi:MAG: hypothetical protein LBU73_06115 [Helicobacteraceae bacterium]|jgi:hypothetical protein|nr:hypothetical protein [Helicobacteraceae bacterium]